MQLVWLLPVLGALVGGLVFFGTMLTANGAPQQAAGAAMGVAFAVLPYVLARGLQELRARPVQISPAPTPEPTGYALDPPAAMSRGKRIVVGLVIALLLGVIAYSVIDQSERARALERARQLDQLDRTFPTR